MLDHHGRVIFYDPTYHVYPVTTCNALQQCEEWAWDFVIGETTAITDTNKQRTEFQYDVLGRPSATILPDGGRLQQHYLDWGTSTQRVREVLNDGSLDGLWTETYFDGLGRTYRFVHRG